MRRAGRTRSCERRATTRVQTRAIREVHDGGPPGLAGLMRAPLDSEFVRFGQISAMSRELVC